MNIEGLIKKARGNYVSPVRRITRVYPVKDAPVFALVLSAGKEADHDKRMKALQLLTGYSAVCSFAVTGESAADAEFVKSAIDQGFELINGGHSGRPFTTGKNVDSSAYPLTSWANVYADTKKLDDMMKENYGYKMAAGMPPYGVESIDGAINAYDLYDYFGYQLVKGSLTLKPGDEAKLAAEIAQDKNVLNGQVVTASLESVQALVDQFGKLSEAGYGVCTVKELLEVSPFSDIGPDSPVFEPAKKLLDAGYPIAYRNNKINPKPYEIMGDTLMTLSEQEARAKKVDRVLDGKTMLGRTSVFNPYCAVLAWAKSKLGRVKYDFPTTSALFNRALLLRDIRLSDYDRRFQYRRGEMIKFYCDILCATEDQDPYGVYDYHMSGIEYDLRKEMGDEAFEALKKEVDDKKAAEAAKALEAGPEGEKKAEEGTILDKFNKKHKDDAQMEDTDSEHKDLEVNKDQIVL